MLTRVAEARGGPVPYIAPWPAGRSWALVLTHDVEHAAGFTAHGVCDEPSGELPVHLAVVRRHRGIGRAA